MIFRQPEPLTASHDTSLFDCGKAPLNQFLQRYALVNQANGSARTFVSLSGGQISGYFGLAAVSAEQAAASSRVSKGLARHPIPMLLLSRLAVDLKAQGNGLGLGLGLGRSLLQSALGKYLQACEVIGARALMVHAIDEAAIGFYQSFGFEPSPVDGLDGATCQSGRDPKFIKRLMARAYPDEPPNPYCRVKREAPSRHPHLPGRQRNAGGFLHLLWLAFCG